MGSLSYNRHPVMTCWCNKFCNQPGHIQFDFSLIMVLYRMSIDYLSYQHLVDVMTSALSQVPMTLPTQLVHNTWTCFTDSMPRDRQFTHDISLVPQMEGKIHFLLILFLAIWSLNHFAHAPTKQLSYAKFLLYHSIRIWMRAKLNLLLMWIMRGKTFGEIGPCS